MNDKHSRASESRRQFIEGSAAGAIGLSAALLPRSVRGGPPTAKLETPGNLLVVSKRAIPSGSTDDLHLRFEPAMDLQAGARLWLFFDFRQGAAAAQTKDPSAANSLLLRLDGNELPIRNVKTPHIPRTFELLPAAPEFLHLIELQLDQPVAAGKQLDFIIQRWTGPRQPIDPYTFWLVVDHDARWEFAPWGFRRYRKFVTRVGSERVATENLFAKTITASLQVTGEYPSVPSISRRRTPGIYWGEFHGMTFNQRPLDDYYNYAKRVTELDFCAPFGFSYNTCVGNVWDEVKAAARRHSEPGKFIGIAGFECGTPPDGSHRCVVFREPDNVPPIFCEDRPPAREKFFQQRFHPDTIVCKTVQELYDTVEKYGGMITGHYHTARYHAEVLCELFQKNLTKPAEEEQRLYELLRAGNRFALAGTSDTHDSMPGNPEPEPHLPMAAGFTGVHADELSINALFDAVQARRVYATSGARIAMRLHSNDRPMGAELALDAEREFEIKIDGTAELQAVELLRDGRPIEQWSPESTTFAVSAIDRSAKKSRPAFYLVRVTQTDGHRGWTSPLWFG